MGASSSSLATSSAPQPEHDGEDAAGCEAVGYEGSGMGAGCSPLYHSGCGSVGRLLVQEGCQGSSAGLTVLQLAPWESSTALGGARGLGVSARVLGCRFPSSW